MNLSCCFVSVGSHHVTFKSNEINTWHKRATARLPILVATATMDYFARLGYSSAEWQFEYELAHEIMALFVLRKFILQTRIRCHPVGLDVWFLVAPFVHFRTTCMRTAKALARLRGCAWAFAGRLWNKYHILMRWFVSPLMDGWVRVLRPFNSISVISRRWKGEHERLCAMKRRLGTGRISPPTGFEPATPWSGRER